MAKSCIGCGKATGGLVGAYTVKLLYGEVCLTCNKKLGSIPNHEFLTPTQIKDVISGRVQPYDVKVSTEFSHPGGGGGGGGGQAAPAKQTLSPEDIRKFKEMLDAGTITQSEYDEIKRQTIGISPVEEIRQYKTLLDSGMIRQDEFEEVKRRLMGLSPTDEVKRHKELLDSGMITQEEFEAVKKRILQI